MKRRKSKRLLCKHFQARVPPNAITKSIFQSLTRVSDTNRTTRQARLDKSHTNCDVRLQGSCSPAHVYHSSRTKANKQGISGSTHASSLLPPLRSAQDRRVVHFVLAVDGAKAKCRRVPKNTLAQPKNTLSSARYMHIDAPKMLNFSHRIRKSEIPSICQWF